MSKKMFKKFNRIKSGMVVAGVSVAGLLAFLILGSGSVVASGPQPGTYPLSATPQTLVVGGNPDTEQEHLPHLYAGLEDGTIVILNQETLSAEQSILTGSIIQSMDFDTEKNQVLFGTLEGVIVEMPLNEEGVSPTPTPDFRRTQIFSTPVTALLATADTWWAATSTGLIAQVDPNEKNVVATFEVAENEISFIRETFDPDVLLLGTSQGKIILWDIKSEATMKIPVAAPGVTITGVIPWENLSQNIFPDNTEDKMWEEKTMTDILLPSTEANEGQNVENMKQQSLENVLVSTSLGEVIFVDLLNGMVSGTAVEEVGHIVNAMQGNLGSQMIYLAKGDATILAIRLGDNTNDDPVADDGAGGGEGDDLDDSDPSDNREDYVDTFPIPVEDIQEGAVEQLPEEGLLDIVERERLFAEVDEEGYVINVFVGGEKEWYEETFGGTWIETWENKPGHHRANMGMWWDGENFWHPAPLGVPLQPLGHDYTDQVIQKTP